MASPVRRPEVLLGLCVLIGGFGLTLTALIATRHVPHAAVRSRGPARIRPGPAGDSSPAALDREWVAYSGQSTCADRSGGDGVSAVRLSPSQIAWFFSDSYLGPAGPRTGFSHLSGFVHNLVVMQTTSAGRSTFVTITGGHACAGPGQPGAATSPVSPPVSGIEADQRYWVADALQVGGYVLAFYNRYLPGSVPYIPVGTTIARYPVSQLARDGRGPAYGEVIRPQITLVPAYAPPGGGTPIVWGAALLQRGSTVYVYGWQSPGPGATARQAYLARVAATQLADIGAWRFYAGSGRWAAGQYNAQPITPAGTGLNIATQYSVISAAGRYWLIQQAGEVGSPDIRAYPATAPWGPFDPAAGILLYRAPGIGLTAADNYQIMYGAGAEPALSDGHTLVISYNVNSVAETAGCVQLAAFTNVVTQPRFIAVPLAVFSAADRNAVRWVAAGPSRYPAIVREHPAQWVNGWAYPSGCPPVPAVSNVSVAQAAGSVRVDWASSGIGVRYRVYLRESDATGYTLVRQVQSPGTTLSHLAPGSTYQVLIVPENIWQDTGPGAAATITVR
jgi:hypothetical protein